MKIGIFITPEGYERPIIEACQEVTVQYELIDIFSHDWIEQFEQANCDGYIIRPPTKTRLWMNLFLSRILLIKDKIEGKCVPDLDSILYYESKIMMLDFYKIHQLPHVPSHTFLNIKEALQFAKETTSFPKMVKSDGGSGGLGVKKINSRLKLNYQIYKSFFTGNIFRGYHSFHDFPEYLKSFVRPLWMYSKTRRAYYPYSERSQGYIHIQELIDMKTEWRMIRIGKSYFGLRKAKGKNGLRSGSGSLGDWADPPKDLLNLVKEWTDKLNISIMSFDIFEDKEGNYLINEMQVCFGTISPSQMYIDGIPGRYVYVDGEWVFDEGEYCRFNCNLLRIELLTDILNVRKPVAAAN
ncbi:hypothetical protein [Chengkuizengella sediminis]|uniref:hypothetical protein n=1 Tax=Chengkuizengella sediminis TaxID=1885917 RepID=UPI0013895239|nr:hypothetical protein [Chengkuizengella sediminis]NDI34864.1 hypothetical protein [Chengkuizengella sediminis]